MALSPKTLDKFQGKPYSGNPEIPDEYGLSVRISPKGKVIFQFKFRYMKKYKRMKLGDYPALTLSEARSKRDECQYWLDRDIDPSNREFIDSKKDTKDSTLSGCIEYWYQNYAIDHRSEPLKFKNRAIAIIPESWLLIDVDKMLYEDWQKLYRTIGRNNCGEWELKFIRTILNYCKRSRHIEKNVFNDLRVVDFAEPAESRDRYLSTIELGKLWGGLDGLSIPENLQIFTRLCIVFGCRKKELNLAKIPDFDLADKVWTVPKTNVKAKRKDKKAILRPIPDQMIPYIEKLILNSRKLKSNYLYPDPENTNKPLDMSRPSKDIKKAIDDEFNFPDRVFHDFRRTLSTQWTELKCPIYLSEKMLGHKLQGILAIYNHSEMMEERRDWIDIWVDKLNLWSGKDNRVVELKSRA